MVSGHRPRSNDEPLAGWRYKWRPRAQVRTEVVWFNFAPGRVHWASYAGRTFFTDHQRIERKAANWGRRYEALPAATKQGLACFRDMRVCGWAEASLGTHQQDRKAHAEKLLSLDRA